MEVQLIKLDIHCPESKSRFLPQQESIIKLYYHCIKLTWSKCIINIKNRVSYLRSWSLISQEVDQNEIF